MNCVLTPDQERQLYAKVFKDLLTAADSKKPFDFKSYAADFYKAVFDKTDDHGLALNYVALLPQNINTAFGQRLQIRKLLAPIAADLVDLESSFSNLDAVTKYLGLAPVTTDQVDRIIQEDAKVSKQKKPIDVQAPKEVDFKGKPISPLSTRGQEGYFVPFNAGLTPQEEAMMNVPDPQKAFHSNIIRTILSLHGDSTLPFSELTLGDHTGFYLSAVPLSSIPENSWYPEMKDPKFAGLIDEVFGPKIALAITSKYGEFVYFDDNGMPTYNRNGKVAHTFLRAPVKNKEGKYYLKYADVVSTQDLIRKENAQRAANNIPAYTEAEAKARAEKIDEARQELFRQLDEIAKYVAEGNTIHGLEITGGSKGYNNNRVQTPLSQTNITLEQISALDIPRVGEKGKGFATLILPGLSKPVQVDRMEMSREIAQKIADVLTKPLMVQGRQMFPEEKVAFVKQFLQSDPTKFFFINYDRTAPAGVNPINIVLNGEAFSLPDTADTEASKKAADELVEKLMTLQKYKERRGPARMNFDQKLLDFGSYVDYEIKGNETIKTEPSYYEFIKNHAKIFAEVNVKGDVVELNPYFTFDISPAHLERAKGTISENTVRNLKEEPSLSQVEIKGKEDEKFEENEKKPIAKESLLKRKDEGKSPDEILEGLKKLKGLDNTATKKQIQAAKTWYENSPLSKHISFETLFNIVNSDAFAQWTVNGITLFAGANYTDLYHEAWHGFTQLYLTKDQKQRMYSDARTMKGSFKTYKGDTVKFSEASDLELEEYLAEDFRKYAMNVKSDAAKRPVRKGIFQKILDFLRSLFGKTTLTDVVSQPMQVATIKDLYDKLYFGNLNEFKPSVDNVQFGTLRKGVEPLSEDYEAISLEDSRLLVDTIDSIFSDIINKQNEMKQTNRFTTSLFTNRENLVVTYAAVKEQLKRMYNDFLDKAEAETDSYTQERLIANARLLDFAIENFGDINQVLRGREKEGMVAYHHKKSKYLGVSSKLVELDEASTNYDDLMKGVRIGDKAGNELSLKEMANAETIYLIRSLHKMRDGKPVLNKLGVPELADFDKVWNALVRTLTGAFSPEDMYARLVTAENIHPEFKEIASKLGYPSADTYEVDERNPSTEEFDMWTRFWQDFNKPRIPLIQLIIDKKEEAVTDDVTAVKYEMRAGEASSETFRVKSNFRNLFNTDSPQKNPYIKQDTNRMNYLDLDKVLKDFTKNGRVLLGKEFDFLKAIGFYLDDKPEIRETIAAKRSVFGIDYMAESLGKLQQYNRKASKPYLLNDPVGFLDSDHPAMNINNNSRRVREVLNFHTKVSDDYSSFSVMNAENNRQYEHSLNNSMSVMVGAINRAKTFEELYNTPFMKHMDPEVNPFIKNSVWMNSIFTLDVPVTDPNYGKKREHQGKPIQIKLENLSGVQILVNSQFPDAGIATSRSDRATKFLSDFHMLILHGRIELMRHASKSTAYDIALDAVRTSGTYSDGLYVPLGSFAPTIGSDDYLGASQAFDIIKKYIGAELARVVEVRSNPEAYRNAVGYNRKLENGKMSGEVFTAFDDVLSDEVKERLYKMVWNEQTKEKKDFLTEIEKPENSELFIEIRNQVKGYFDRMTAENAAIMNENPYYHPEVFRKVSSQVKNLIEPEMTLTALRAFTYNSWIHNMESAINIYGDFALYNHSKEEFHKRNAGMGSTGTLFRTDQSAIQYINQSVGRPYEKSLINSGEVQKTGVKTFDGTFNTAVMQDLETASVYASEYENIFRDHFKSIYTADYGKKNGLSSDQLNAIIEAKTQSALAPYMKMTEGDGQGWVGFDSYRIMRKLEGKWSAQQEELYQRILSGRDVSTADMLTFFPPYKVQHYGPLQNSVKAGGLPIVAFHKFSLYPLIPSVVKGTNLDNLHKKMIANDIDYALFESGSKVGAVTSNGKPDKFYSKDDKGNRQVNTSPEFEFTKNTIHLNYLKNQQDIASKFKGSVIFSTQLRKLILEGLFEQGKPVRPEFLELAQNYEKNIERLTALKKQELLREAGWVEDANGNLTGDLEDLIDIIRTEMENRELPDHEIDMIEYDKATGELRYDVSMHYDAEKIEKMLTSIVNNRLIRQKVTGESLVQVATSMFENTGFTSKFTNPTEADRKKYLGTNDLPTYHKGADGKTTAMKVKVALQGNFEKLLSREDVTDIAFRENISTLEALNKLVRDEEWLNKDDNRKLVTLVGVRIPVQGLNSMEFMEVYEFLPPSAGNIIVPPSEIVAKSGADFDIDKLSVFVPTLTSKGKYATREFESVDEIEAEIKKLEEQRKINWGEIDQKIRDIKQKRKENRPIKKEQKQAIVGALIDAKNLRDQLVEEARQIVLKLKDTRRMDNELADLAANEYIGDFHRMLDRKSKKLEKIDAELARVYNELKEVKEEKIAKLREEMDAFYREGNEEGQNLYDMEYELEQEKAPLNNRLSELRELKRNFINTVENDLISNIRSILEMPHNYLSLIRPNDTDIVRPIAVGESNSLDQYVQKYNARKSKTNAPVKKGVSPTRVLEYGYNLYKHEQNNIGKKTLGMAAVENTYNTIFNRIGAYMMNNYTFKDKKGPQERRVKLLLDHHNFTYTDQEGKQQTGISLSNLYDVNNENKVSDVISQIMNGLVDIEKDAWIANLQGNNELMPILLFLLKSGVPIKEAAWFVSQPLVLDYVDQQRIAKSTFADPLGKVPRDNDGRIQRTWFRYAAKKAILTRLADHPLFEEAPEFFGNKSLYKFTVGVTDKVFGQNKIAQSTIENIVKNADRTSDQAVASFLHFLEIEEMMKGISDLKFKTNFDTKKSPNLYDALKRVSEVKALTESTRIPTELVNKMLDDSILGSFFIQDFQLKLWKNVMKFRTNDSVTDYLSFKLKEMSTRDDIDKTFGDEEDFVKAFNNDLILSIFQNHIRGFNLNNLKSYKGYDAKVEMPVKAVNKLEFGAIVKDGVLYIDRNQLEEDWNTKAYLQSNTDENSYRSRGLAPVTPITFNWKGVNNKNEFFHYVAEREYLRSIIPFSEYKESAEYTEDYKYFEELLGLHRPENLSDDAFAKVVNRRAYEEMLKRKALQNIFNLNTMLSHPTESVAGQFLRIVNSFSDLAKDYTLVANLQVNHDRDLNIYNLMLRDKDLDATKLNTYYENYNKLKDPSVMKVPNMKENLRISEFFQRLPIYAYMQSGLSKNQFSLTDVVSPEPFLQIMQEPIKEFTKEYLTWTKLSKAEATKQYGENIVKMLDTSGDYHKLNNGTAAKKEGEDYMFNPKAWMLDVFYDYFVSNNANNNRRMRSRYRDYLVNAAGSQVARTYDKGDVLVNFSKTTAPGVYTFSPIKKGNELVKLADSYPKAVFVFRDTWNAMKKGLSDTGNEMNLRKAQNGFGIRVANMKLDGPWGIKNEIGMEKVKAMVEEDLAPIIEAKKAGSILIFSPFGYGDQLTGMDREIYVYLSKRLFEEFGYVNPGSLNEPSVREIVDRMQGISQTEIDELIAKCMQ